MKIALRISVTTARGARDGVPRLLALLARREASATFYFNLGPARAHRWLPAREIGARAAPALHAARDAGHELGLHGWDPVRWRHFADDGGGWVEAAMGRACEAFERLAGEPARTHAAPSWRTGRRALRLTQQCGFDYASDVRGRAPFMPVCDAELVLCPQLPTTLPSLDELLAAGGDALASAPERALAAAPARDTGHVFALAAEGVSAALEPTLERLLDAWRARGDEVVSMRTLFESLDLRRLPRCTLEPGSAGARADAAASQGRPFLA